MTTSLALELLGYAASILIAVSLMMRSIVRLRVINMTGAAAFSLYGFLIGALPVGLLNLLTASINVVQLIRLRRKNEIFRILEVDPADSRYLPYFLQFEKNEIERFVPGFRYDPTRVDVALIVLRDLVPAGVLLAERNGSVLEVHLDYVVAQYRDLQVGRFLFCDQVDFFRALGVDEIVSPAGSRENRAYLRRIGFEPAGDDRYSLVLGAR